MSSSRDDFSIAIRSALLQRGAGQKFSLIFYICLALIIFFLEVNKISLTSFARAIINDGIYRISNVATSPFKLIKMIKEESIRIVFTYKENNNLREELKNLKAKDLKVEYLTNQNKKLTKILKTENTYLEEKNILAKVLLDKDSPYLKSLVLNVGSNSGILKGMPVLDGNYLIGKIVEVNYLSSRVLLLNDLNSRIPVTFGNEATQAILTGKGEKNPKLEYLPEKYIPINDLNVFTSGKDGIFLPGIPIGKTKSETENFLVKLYSDPNQLSYVTIQLVNTREEKEKF